MWRMICSQKFVRAAPLSDFHSSSESSDFSFPNIKVTPSAVRFSHGFRRCRSFTTLLIRQPKALSSYLQHHVDDDILLSKAVISDASGATVEQLILGIEAQMYGKGRVSR
ncbi:MAG: hypothetical protein IK079_02715, partial [Desulfovibrio sp.]|nr:hypothetical protein [Desulfovibrio sp.]